jgi:hypothetical protein
MLSERKLAEMVEQYDQQEIRISTAYLDGGTGPLSPRFSRSAGNQIDNGPAALSRYAIWANTVRDNIVRGMQEMESGDTELGRYHLIRVTNSLSAFCDVQAHFDPLRQAHRE